MSRSFSQHSRKLVLLGDSGVGKSSIVIRYVKEDFYAFQESTIGAAFLTKTISVNNEYDIKFEIWDTAGQERYHSLAPMYYRGAPAAIVVYDITDPASFERAKAWITELQSSGAPDIVIALAGNKADLEQKRKVSIEEGRTVAQECGILFTETSAKENINISELFLKIAEKIPRSSNEDHRKSWAGMFDEDDLKDPKPDSSICC